MADTRELPEQLSITDDFEIQEALTEFATRILLHPSECYLDDDIVQLENVIRAIVDRYNQWEALMAYRGYVSFCINQNRVPQGFEKFKKDLSLNYSESVRNI